MNIVTGTTSKKDLYSEYPYLFCSSIWNNGVGDGNSHMDSWEVIQKTGCPTSEDFGGFEWGKEYGGWMSGYDKWYNAMHNKVAEIIKIDGGDPGYVDLVKSWLYDHGKGDAVGGALVYTGTGRQIEEGYGGRDNPVTSDDGGGHALAIAGWDDNVGSGAWLMVNNWSDGIRWELYSAAQNGNLITGVRVKDHTPVLTFKTTITCDVRNKIKIETGVANSLDASEPEITRGYGSAFNYSGGPNPMGGDMQKSTIEIGLDLTDLLEHVSGDEATFFLKISSNGVSGEVNALSLMDYSSGSVNEIEGEGASFGGGGALLKVSRSGDINAIIKKGINGARNTNALLVSHNPADKSVRFSFPSATVASLKIRDVAGRSVYSGDIGQINTSAGKSSASWNMTGNNGKKIMAGVYVATVSFKNLSGNMQTLSAKVNVAE
jgi:hypothetical protein